MANKLLILDKDGTLVIPASGEKFVQHPRDQVLLPKVAKRIQEHQAAGYDIAIATNQGGVSAGFKTLTEAKAEVDFCLGLLPGVTMAAFCPDMEGKEAWITHGSGWMRVSESKPWFPLDFGGFRKPGCGMLSLLQGGKKYERILYVGDRPEDEGAAEAWRDTMVIVEG